MIKGKVWKFGDNVDTDQIISSQYLLLPGVAEMKNYVFESVQTDFIKHFNSGDIIIAGYNFGCGSSREQAPLVLKEIGASLIIAKSFARIFFRNSVNIGLPIVVCNEIYDEVDGGQSVSCMLKEGKIFCCDKTYVFNALPQHIMKLLNCGGLINAINSGYLLD